MRARMAMCLHAFFGHQPVFWGVPLAESLKATLRWFQKGKFCAFFAKMVASLFFGGCPWRTRSKRLFVVSRAGNYAHFLQNGCPDCPRLTLPAETDWLGFCSSGAASFAPLDGRSKDRRRQRHRQTQTHRRRRRQTDTQTQT